MEETLDEHSKSLAAPFIFIIVMALQYLDRYLAQMKKKASMSEKDMQLRAEIKKLLMEASTYSQPSTFAQAAKLRRIAAAKEKELAQSQASLSKDMKLSFGLYEKIMMISKVVMYVALLMWFWRIPVAAISKELVQPFGWFLSWKSGGSFSDNVTVGIIPWLILSTRVGRYFCKKLIMK